MTNEIAERYSQGLFELAKENNTLEEKKKQAEFLKDVLESNSDIPLLMRAVKVSKDEKKQFIETVFGDALDRDMCNFLKILIDKGRMPYVKDIVKSFLALANRDLGFQEVTVESARKLKEEDLERIRSVLEQKTGNKIIIENRVVPSLIAGIKVITGSQVTDITMKSKIERMKQTLLKGGHA